MARTLDPPDGNRFFARLLAAALECPRCGFVDTFHWRKLSRPGINRLSRRPEDQPGGWDPLTGVWRCKQCGMAVILGILAWPIAPGGGGRVTRPRDQVPSERELAQIRARGGGWWLPDSRAVVRSRAEETNVTARCTCLPPKLGTLPWTGEPAEADRDPQCLIHGDLAENSEKGERSL